MKILVVTTFLALAAFHSTQSAQAQIAHGNDRLLIGKIVVDGCFVGPIPDAQP